jgi:hypothetical protein
VAAARLNLEIESGATFRRTFIWQDSDGIPINVTAYSAHMQVRSIKTAADPLIDLTSTPVTSFSVARPELSR